MTRIVVCGLGGTIAMTATAADLIAAVPGAAALGLDLDLLDVASPLPERAGRAAGAAPAGGNGGCPAYR